MDEMLHSSEEILQQLKQPEERAGNLPARLFVDMDGTLAVFRPVDTMETLYEPGYFSSLSPHDNVLQAVKSIAKGHPEVEVHILSAVLTDSPYALQEKNEWLDRYLPEVDAAHRIFPPCGADKKEYIPGGIRSTDYLLDDYTYNLSLWHPPGQGIKLLNGINHSRGTWEHDRVRFDKSPKELVQNILAVMHGQQVMDEKPQFTRDEVLKELKDQAWNNVFAYSGNYAMSQPKKGYEDEWSAAIAKAEIIDQMAEGVSSPYQVITKDSEHIKIEGLPGTWYCLAADSYQGKAYFALDSEDGVGNSVVVDVYGKVVVDNFQPWLGDIEAHLADRISERREKEEVASLEEHLSMKKLQIEEKLKTDYPDIEKMVGAINDSYLAMGRKDRWSLGIDDPSEGPYIYNPLYFGDNDYYGTPDEIRNIVQNLYSEHFGKPYSPDSLALTDPAPFFGKIEYHGSTGIVGETILYNNEEKYLKACAARYEYGVPLSGTRITEEEYTSALNQEREALEAHEPEEERNQEWGED